LVIQGSPLKPKRTVEITFNKPIPICTGKKINAENYPNRIVLHWIMPQATIDFWLADPTRIAYGELLEVYTSGF
jgi:hypothetical protein